MKKKATTAAIIIGTALSVSLPVYGAQWKQDSTGWWYEQDNGLKCYTNVVTVVANKI